MTNILTGDAAAYAADVASGAARGHVFISYSRRDYYFAESLAFHLERAGVPAWLDARQLTPGADWARSIEAALADARCLVLVVSPDSMRSPQVRAEWKRAVANGQRIVLAVFRSATIPDDLSNADVVDFRGRFGRGVKTLAGVDSAKSRQTPRRHFQPAVIPPGVALIALILTTLWIGFTADGIAFGDLNEMNNVGGYLAIAVIYGIVLYFIGVAFLRRRMSMSRVLVCFAIYGFIFGYPVLEVAAGPTVPHVYPEGMLQFVRDHWIVQALLLGTTATGVFTLTVLRPADLLRWTPTGKAWSSYRRSHYRVPADYDPSGAQLLTGIRAFQIVCDTPDEPAGHELRRRLLAMGIPEHASAEATTVLLLTNRTRLPWLLDQMKTLPASLITFVGSGLKLREELSDLWRRQWVDARSWRLLNDPTPLQKRDQTPARITLPALPEALTRTILPSQVSRANHLSMSLGMLLIGVALAANPQSSDTIATARDALRMALTFVSCGVAAVWLRMSHQFVVRRISERAFYDNLRVIAPAIGILGLINLAVYWNAGGHPLRIGPCVATLLAAPIALLRMRSSLKSWFPSIPRESYDVTLAPARAWRRTALVAVVHLMLWAIVLNPE